MRLFGGDGARMAGSAAYDYYNPDEIVTVPPPLLVVKDR
jgi:hypothetical protein